MDNFQNVHIQQKLDHNNHANMGTRTGQTVNAFMTIHNYNVTANQQFSFAEGKQPIMCHCRETKAQKMKIPTKQVCSK